MKKLLKVIVPKKLWRDFWYLRKWKFRQRGDLLKNLNIHNLWVFLKLVMAERLTVIEPLDANRNLYLSIQTTVELPRVLTLKEPETVAWIKHNVKQGDIFYDIGANVGAYSLLAGKVAEGGTVYAFEPSSATFAALCKNIEINQLGQIIIPFGVGLSDETRLAPFHYSSTQPGDANHQWDVVNPLVGYTQQTLVYRLDDLISQFQLKLPNLIKIDVDGPELSVLLGASQTLKGPRLRSVLIEVDRKVDRDNLIAKVMNKYGFHLVSSHLRGINSVRNNIFVR